MAMRLLFAAGGTGGHIFPAVAVADKCRELDPGCTVEFVGTRGRLEEKVVPRAGYPLNFLWISGFERKLSLKMLMLPLKIGTSFVQALALLGRFKPHAVICAGAYVSYPIGMMASLRGIPLILMESNALPGMVVRKLAGRAAEIHVAFGATTEHLRGARTFVSGNPVRKAFFERHDVGKAREHFGLDPEKPTLFAFGGSQGSRAINNALDAIVQRLIAEGMQVIWQTGTSYAGSEPREGGGLHEPGLYRSTFIYEMELGYAAADLVLARAGATTIAELAAVGKASILVPLPTAADDHQRVNAVAMERAGASVMILDAELPTKLFETITGLIRDAGRLAAMGASIARMAVPDADDRIAGRVVEIARRKR
jgi:UDP-N-acetylglucosamine--N-acetylmuramyl-(pentapeptide) pyrophosphoryl-undecaprenol N-acetylglucosamine transferase